MLILLFGRTGGSRRLSRRLGIKIVFALPGMLLATMFVSLPFVIREVMPVLEQIGIEQESAAYTLGAGPLATFWHVTLPAIRWGLLYGVSLTFARGARGVRRRAGRERQHQRPDRDPTLFIFRALDERNTVAAYGAVVLALLSFSLLMVMEIVKRRTRGTS